MGLNPQDRIGRAIKGAVRSIFRIAIVQRAVEDGLAFLQAYGHGDPDDPDNQELLQEADIDHVQHFGFESFPPADTEGIVADCDGGMACIAERITLPSGLAALVVNESRTYGEDGQSILHKTGGDIEAEPKAGKHFKIGADAAQKIALDTDFCVTVNAFDNWALAVEAGILAAGGPVIPPWGATQNIAQINASSTKGKCK